MTRITTVTMPTVLQHFPIHPAILPAAQINSSANEISEILLVVGRGIASNEDSKSNKWMDGSAEDNKFTVVGSDEDSHDNDKDGVHKDLSNFDVNSIDNDVNSIMPQHQDS